MFGIAAEEKSRSDRRQVDEPQVQEQNAHDGDIVRTTEARRNAAYRRANSVTFHSRSWFRPKI